MRENILTIAISVFFALLVYSIVVAIIPYPAYDYSDFPYYETEQDCISAGGTWTIDDTYGDWCYDYTINENYYANQDAKYGNHAMIFYPILFIIGLISFFISLKKIKQEIVSQGILGGSLILLLASSFLMTIINALALILTAGIVFILLLWVALTPKKKKK
jgi:hypothetical protein